MTLAYPKAPDCIIDLGCLDPRVTAWPSARGLPRLERRRPRPLLRRHRRRHPRLRPRPDPAGPLAGHPRPLQAPARRRRGHRHRRPRRQPPRPPSPQPERTFPVRPGAGWYRGDLHSHTFHSDARGAPELLHAAARQAGLDFLAVTDHNTTTQRRYFHPASSRRPRLPPRHGGHHRPRPRQRLRRRRLDRLPHDPPLRRARPGAPRPRRGRPALDQPRQADHPLGLRAPRRRLHGGLAVRLAGLELDLARPLAGPPRRAAAASPPSAAATSTSPTASSPKARSRLGRPTTVLWLPELSEAAILAAMKAGRGYVTEAPRGPHLALTAGDVADGRQHRPPARVTAEAEVRGAAGDTLVWIDASGPVRVEPIPADDWRGRLSRRARSASSAPRSSPTPAATPSLDGFRAAVGEPAAPRRPDARRTSPPTRSAAPSPTRSTVRGLTHAHRQRALLLGRLLPRQRPRSPPTPTSTRSPPPATAAPSSAPSASCPPTLPRSETRSPAATSP